MRRLFAALFPLLLVALGVAAGAVMAKGANGPDLVIGMLLLVVGAALMRIWAKTRRRNDTVAAIGLLVLSWFSAVTLVPVLRSAGPISQRVQCLSSLKQLALGLMIYQNDCDDRLPPADRWRTLIALPSDANFVCPYSTSPWSYAMNSALSCFNANKIVEPVTTVMLFEADAQARDEYGGPADVVNRHNHGSNFAWADGHTKYIGPSSSVRPIWSPRK